MARVWVAMSGGVDSSVAAALMAREGHDVTGVTMRLLEDDGPCCGTAGTRAALAVCERLGIPHIDLDLRECFERTVVAPYCDAYAAGLTPNPCLDCNARVKFAELLRRAALQGVDVLATGHYARIAHGPCGPALLRGADATRDQSYFLYRMTPEQMEHVVFPVGDMTKDAVRAYARDAGLPTAEAPESREACFVPDGRVRAFVGARRPEAAEAGPVEDPEGRVIGTHAGIAGFTVGQRKGIGAAGGKPRYVVRIDAARRAVVVGGAEDLDVREVTARDCVWHGEPVAEGLSARVRYRGAEVPCSAVREGHLLRVTFTTPVRGVAPGQAVVCYAGDTVVGGGTVETTR